jgi:signal transduction histidine kinase
MTKVPKQFDAPHYWVRDNGAGIPVAAQRRLFQVFQRFHPQLAHGEGMGLAIVKRVVERHGGRVWAESQEGAGTTFHVTLPAADSKVEQTGSEAPAARLSQKVRAVGAGKEG